MFVDTHAHTYAEAFAEDRDQSIERALENGVKKILLPNIDLESLPGLLQLQEKYPDICYPMIGLHPCDVKPDTYETVLKTLKQELDSKPSKYIAIGETGIDLYWDKSTQEAQIEALEIQVQWCKETLKPIVLHARESLEVLIEVLSRPKNKGIRGVFHCFTGTFAQAQQIIAMGFDIGIGGVLTFKKSSLVEVIEKLPLEHIILETDSPYLAPTPYRGKRNESAYIPIIAQKLAEIKGISIEEVAKCTTENAERIFFKS
jgi:TatD DNase family protein